MALSGAGGVGGVPASGGIGGSSGASAAGGNGGGGGAAASGGAAATGCAADVIVAFDNSLSMTQEAPNPGVTFGGFIEVLQDAGVDVRVAVVSDTVPTQFGPLPSIGVCVPAPSGSGNCPDDTKLPTYLHVPQLVSSADTLLQLMNEFPSYTNLRSTVPKTILVISDDDAAAQPTVAEFIQFFDDSFAEAPWRFSSIFCGTFAVDCVATGLVYADLVAQTGGAAVDLATTTLEQGLTVVAESIVATSQCP
jgi:hypothetical protein